MLARDSTCERLLGNQRDGVTVLTRQLRPVPEGRDASRVGTTGGLCWDKHASAAEGERVCLGKKNASGGTFFVSMNLSGQRDRSYQSLHEKLSFQPAETHTTAAVMS